MGLEVKQDLQKINHLLVSEIKAEMFSAETRNDEVLQAVKAIVQSGWPAEKTELTLTVAIYYDFCDELVIQECLLFRGDRLVVPKTLQKCMFQALHSSHQGIELTLRCTITTSPYHHQSNDKDESAVKEAKKILKKTAESESDLYLALLAHRNTPQEGFGASPGQHLLSRRTKTNLPTSSNLLKPSVAEDALEKDKLSKLKQKFYYDRAANDLQDLQKDDVVRMQPFWLNEKTWRKAKVLKPLGRRSYVVKSNRQLYISNWRHLKCSAEADSMPAEEWTMPSNHHDSKGKDHLANEQPMLKPVAPTPVKPMATTKVNRSMTTTESNKDQLSSPTSVDQD